MVQGAKQLGLGGEAYRYDTAHFLLTSLDLPANSEVLEADSHTRSIPSTRGRAVGAGMGLGDATPALLCPFDRPLELLDEPDAIAALAPLIQREIHYRLLVSNQAAKLRQIAAVDGQGHRQPARAARGHRLIVVRHRRRPSERQHSRDHERI